MRYLRAFSKYAIGTGLVLVVGLLTTPILTRLISTEDMGKYSMFMTLGNLHFYTSLFRSEISLVFRFYNDEKPESRNYLLRICLLLPMGVFLICGLYVCVYKPFSVYITGEVSFSGVIV